MNRTRIILILAGAVVIAAGFVFYQYNPEKGDFPYPQCTFHKITGMQCPGCGMQRAFHHIIHWEIGTAMAYNPLVVLAIPYFLLFIGFQTPVMKNKLPAVKKTLYQPRAAWVWMGILVIFWILRNLL